MSKADKLLRHLKRGGSITGKTSLNRFGIYRLSSVIHRFRRAGLSISTEKVTQNGVEFACYKIDNL